MPCNHQHCGSEHNHDDSEEKGIEYSLYTKINLSGVECLNEAKDGSGKLVFKPWDKRLDRSELLESDVDDELLLKVPFTGVIKLKSLILIGGHGGTHPKWLSLYKDRPAMTFDDVGLEPDQKFQLIRDENGSVEYQMKMSKFASLSHLTLHLKGTFEQDNNAVVYYVGLRGEFMEPFRQEITLATYEARPVPQDHKGEIPDAAFHQIF